MRLPPDDSGGGGGPTWLAMQTPDDRRGRSGPRTYGALIAPTGIRLAGSGLRSLVMRHGSGNAYSIVGMPSLKTEGRRLRITLGFLAADRDLEKAASRIEGREE